MNKKAKTIGVIVAYPEKEKMHSDFSGIAGYTKNLLLGFNDEQKKTVIVFSNIKNSAKVFEDDGIMVDECWKRNSFSFVARIIEHIKKYPNLKVIHIQHEFNLFGGSFSILFFLYLLKKLKKLNKKVVVTYHGVIAQKIINKKFKEVSQIALPAFLLRFVLSFFYKVSNQYIDKVIVHEKCFKQFLISDYGFEESHVAIIHHGIEDRHSNLTKEVARNNLKIKQDKKIILFFGFLAGYKGVDLLLDAFELLSSEYFLILAGGKPRRVEKNNLYNRWYQKIEIRLKNNPNILQTGFVLDEKIDTYFSATDVVVLPYLQMLSASGPMSLAISLKKPFLASDVFAEALEDDRIIFERNAISLKEAIENYFENQNFFDEYIEKRREGRLWSKISQLTYNLYSS